MNAQWLKIILLLLVLGKAPLVFSQNDTLTVGIYVNPPFVIQTADNTFEGLSIELWENVATSEQLAFRYELQSDFIGVLKKLEYREIDLTINPM
ncbi:MAG: transporter substrate-binding domain-containing protein, partial [Bacteroidota bacterium]